MKLVTGWVAAGKYFVVDIADPASTASRGPLDTVLDSKDR